MFEINTKLNGFQILFKNGWMISVMFGPDHQCENRGHVTHRQSCENAEVALFHPNGSIVKIFPYMEPENMIRIAMGVMNQ